ncbi:MAG TPA: FecR domain-containing protein [Rhizomicrobium sp.]|nr:FecR domain-containing protein [Rhizomicrobium sp.]
MSDRTAKEVRAQAAEWISRRDGEGWNEAAQAELDAWLAKSDAHVVAFLRAEAAWSRADKLVALKPQSSRRIAETLKDVLPTALRAVAAAVVIAVVGVAANTYLATFNEKTYTTPVGGRETITLVDGSQIALNTDTVLRMDLSGRERKVWLDRGEAYFHVTHNAQRPFRVFAGNRTVTDLGTRFSVRRDSERFEVAVMEGKVAFDPGKEQQKPIALLPGDVVVATTTKVSVTKKPSRALAESLGWQRGLLIFDNTTLADAANEFNRYNGEKLVVARSAAHLPVVGTFRANDVEAFARVTKEVFGLRSEKRGQSIVIAR